MPISVGDRLLLSACQLFGVESPEELRSPQRPPLAILARWTVAMILHRRVGWGKQKIASFLSMEKPSIIHAIREAEDLYRTSPLIYSAVQQLETEIFGESTI